MKQTVKIAACQWPVEFRSVKLRTTYVLLAALLTADLAVHIITEARKTAETRNSSAPFRESAIVWHLGGDALDWSSPGSTPLARR